MGSQLAVLTPTYNRAHKLQTLFDSLQKQDNLDFIWIVSDDGSLDDTKEIVNGYLGTVSFNELRYQHHENMGKSRSIEKAIKDNEDIDFFLIVDSDDRLVGNAISRVFAEMEVAEAIGGIGVIRFKMTDSSGTPLNPIKTIPFAAYKDLEGVHDVFEQKKVKYKREERFSGVFRGFGIQYSYPKFINENFITEECLTMFLHERGRILFSTSVIGVAEYQAGGITDSGRRLRLDNPYGAIYTCWLSQINKSPFVVRSKNAVLAQAYAEYRQISKDDLEKMGIPGNCLKKWAKPLGSLLAKRWAKAQRLGE